MENPTYEMGNEVVWAVIRKNGHIFDNVYIMCDTEETAKAVVEQWNNQDNYYDRWGFPGYEYAPVRLYRKRVQS